ncbi:MAG: DUF6731 family protein [Clostridia bacterium]
MKKEIQFDYYEVHCFEMNEDNTVATDIKFDIDSILSDLSKIEVVKRTQIYKNDKIRFQIVNKTEDELWEMQVLRLRESMLPGIADEEGNFEIITLEDGQYIGESVTLLYDPNNCIICMQRNNRAILPSTMEYLLRAIYKGSNELITLKPIIKPRDLTKINDETLYRKISIGIATDEVVLNEENPTPIGRMLNNINEYDCGYVTLELGFNGRLKKNTTMASGLSFQTIEELLEDNKVDKLKIAYKTTEDSFVEYADLIENKTHDILSFEYQRNKDISHKLIFEKIHERYNERKNDNKIYR